jgi:PAS domain S-box-containing protein
MTEPNASASELERKLELVVQTGMLLAQSLELEQIVQATTDAGLQLCGAQFGAFFYNVVNAAGESYQLYVLSGVDREKFANFAMPRNTTLFAPTFGGQGIVRSDDISQDPRYGKNAPHSGMPSGHLPVRSYLAVPVKSQAGEVLGALFYGHDQPGMFAESSEVLISTVAAQASVAIENSRLREDLKRKIVDVDELQRHQKDSVKRLNELAAIVEGSDDAIVSKDLNGTITSWNKAATRILGYTSDEIVGKSILRLIPPHLYADEKRIISSIKAGQRIEHFETVRLNKSGELMDVSITVSPVRDQSGEIVGASKILRDVSSRKRSETSLLQAEKIAATGRMAATIAHEINNPLEAVMNLMYLLRPSLQGEEAQQYLIAAEAELTRVSHIAKQTLGYYREHAAAAEVTVAELVEHACMIYAPRCSAADIRLERHLESSAVITLRRGEIMQVVSNLIANSIYAMAAGGKLRLGVRNVREPEAGVVIEVEDNGTGISAVSLPRVFDAFYTTRQTIGTGIGLFVAKQFVEGHGGRISLKSNTDADGHGTCVSVFLPLVSAYDPLYDPPVPPSLLEDVQQQEME